MKRLISLFLVLTSIFVLSGCQGIHFVEESYSIDGYQVYRYDHKTSEIECDRISRFGLFVRDGDDDYLTDKDFGECRNTLYVKEKGEYYNLSKAVELELFSISDVLEVNWDFNVYHTHSLLDYLEVDNLVFRNANLTLDFSEVITGTPSEELDRILEISESVYQKFIIDYYPESTNHIGYIDVYFEDTLVGTLEVHESGIYDPVTNAFQESNTSELHGLYQTLMNNV